MPGSKQKSNQSLLIEWFEAYKTGVYRYIRLIVSSKEDAEDILQKTFLALHQKGDTIQSIKYPKTYIYKVARNYALKKITRKPVNIVSLDNLLTEPAEDPFHQWITAEMGRQLDDGKDQHQNRPKACSRNTRHQHADG